VHKNQFAPGPTGVAYGAPRIVIDVWRRLDGSRCPFPRPCCLSQESHPTLGPADLELRPAGLDCPLPTSPPLSVPVMCCKVASLTLSVYKTPFTRYNWLSNRLNNRLNNRLHNWLHRVNKHSTGWLFNRFDNRLYRVNGVLRIYSVTRVYHMFVDVKNI